MNPEGRFLKKKKSFVLTNGDFFVPALPLFSHLLIWGFNLTQAIVEGKVHITTDAIYVVCQSGPKHQFLPRAPVCLNVH